MKTSQKIMVGLLAIPMVSVLSGGTFASSNTYITDQEKEMLIYGQQEERLAQDVYSAMYDKYQLETFTKISSSETKHVSAMGRLLSQYNIPETTGYGELQATYDALIAKGNISLEDAINVGIAVEILDITDIDKVLKETSNESIINTYEKLRKGSINHLNAYVAQLQKNNFETDLNWQQFTTQEQVNEKLECLNLSPEEREAKEKEKHSEKGENGENGEHKGQGRENDENGEHKGQGRENDENGEHKGQGRENDENGEHKGQGKWGADMTTEESGNNEKQENKNKYEKKEEHARKGDKYERFSGEKLPKTNFGDESEVKHKEAVHFLQERGIIKGYEDGEFKPERGVSRAESLKILLEATNVSTAEVSRTSFSDVPASEWYAPYVEKAKEMGIVKGYEDGTFKPASTVNQAELLKIAFQSFGIELSDYPTTSSEWFAQYLQYAIDNNLLDIENVNPSQTMTRDEFSEFIYRLIVQQEEL